ncbi:hypothetical protein, partial [Timonella senegalensis]
GLAIKESLLTREGLER